MTSKTIRFGLSCLAAALLAAPAVRAQHGATDGEWRSYGGDLGGTKYSPLDQIDASNFSDLEIAWRWRSADADLDLDALREIHPDLSILSFKATPLMVGGVVYVVTPLRLAAAIDAGTGETRWVYDPDAIRGTRYSINAGNYSSRGLAYWTDGQEERIYYGTPDGYLLAVDAATGEPARGFGDDGSVDLAAGIPRAGRETTDDQGHPWIGINSPPIVARGVVVTPTSISDQPITREQPPGWVRGIDARTGQTRWTFRTVPLADDFGADTWANESWRYSGGANVWAAFSVDEELGYIYLPTGTPTNDYYGGHRPGDNLFAESLVALDIETGQRMWHFQAVHHGVWDYDFPTHPNLVDVTVDGRAIRAIAQVSKQGFTYVFDRVTGEPVWPIEERPVETDTDLVGEVLAPTQPFPTKPPPFEELGSSIEQLVDFTPELRAMAVEAVRNHRLGGVYSPPMLSVEGGLQGTIQRPGALRRRQLGRLGRRSGDGNPLRPVHQRLLDPQVLHAGRRGRESRLHAGRLRHALADAAGAAAVQAPLHADDRHRPQHRRPRVDAAQRRRQPPPQPPPFARPRPSAARRRRPRRPRPDEDAARQRTDRGGRRERRRPTPRGPRQGDGRDRRLRRLARRRHRHADDLPA